MAAKVRKTGARSTVLGHTHLQAGWEQVPVHV